MAPRKSDASKGVSAEDSTPQKEKEGVNIEVGPFLSTTRHHDLQLIMDYVQDLGLPRTVIQRLAKGVLPPNTQIQKDGVLAISKSATVFVSYLSAT